MKNYADYLGISAASLCLIHCLLIPPFLVMNNLVQYTNMFENLWWDLSFGLISLYAVYQALKDAHLKWIRLALVIGWLCLSAVIFDWHFLSYVGSGILIIAHSYNFYYCHRLHWARN